MRSAKRTLASLLFTAFVILSLLLLRLPSAQAQSAPVINKAQEFTTFTEWPVGTAGTEFVAIRVSGNNGAYFARQEGKIGFLDIDSNGLTEWTVPTGFGVAGLAVHGQKLVLAEPNFAGSDSRVAVLDPTSDTLTEWAVPHVFGSNSDFPFGVASHEGSVFFTDVQRSPVGDFGVIGRLNSLDNQFTLWRAATNHFVVDIAPSGAGSTPQVWVTLSASTDGFAGVGRLNPATNTFTVWTLPSSVGPGIGCLDRFNQPAPCPGGVPSGLAFASDGSVIFLLTQPSFILDFGVFVAATFSVGALDPATNTLRVYALPALQCGPTSLPSIGGGTNVAVFSHGFAAFPDPVLIGTLDLSAPSSSQAVAPTENVVTPSTQVVVPTITGLVKTSTTVTPTVTAANRLVSRGFVMYPLPSGVRSLGVSTISRGGHGAILFTESNQLGFNSRGKIGLLQ